MEKKLPLKTIKVGKRVRKDFGDVKALATSISKVGLLQAIAVTTKDNRLICGERRLRAVKSLKLPTIDCRMIDIVDIAEAEHAENEFRKTLTLSEKAQLASIMFDDQGGKRSMGKQPKNDTRHSAESNGKVDKQSTQQVAVQAGFTDSREMGRVTIVSESGTSTLIDAMDDGKIKPSRAALIADRPAAEQKKILADAKQEDGTFKFTVPSSVTKRKPSFSSTVLAGLKAVLAKPWGVSEQYGSVEEMFNSKNWKRKENRVRIGEYCDAIDSLAKEYAKLDKSCKTYCKKHNL